MSYGGYFWIAHTVQQMANDAARATIAGLNMEEREALANAIVARAILRNPTFEMEDASVRVEGDARTLTVSVRYDATGSVFWAFDKLLPMPSATIERNATIEMGGL